MQLLENNLQGTIKNRIYHKYEKESSKLRMIPGGAWTINLADVNLDEIDIIIYETKKNIYKISKHKAKTNGRIQVLGGESKLIIPICYWEKSIKGS